MKRIKEFQVLSKNDINVFKKLRTLLFIVLLMCFCFSCKHEDNKIYIDASQKEEKHENEEISENNIVTLDKAHKLVFSDDMVTLDGLKLNEYNYVWHNDINGDYDVVKDCPGEYYEGDKPSEDDFLYIAHDIRYIPVIDKEKFYKTPNKDIFEWTCNYENPKYKEYSFFSLPCFNDNFPIEMMHTEKEAYNNPCFHIIKEGTYELSGKWHGQIFIDLGGKSKTDINKKIKLILNNFDVSCDVGPAILIKNAYECDNEWANRNDKNMYIDGKDIGVEIIIKDDTINHLQGNNVYRMYKTVLKKNGREQKVSMKYDGAISSEISFAINGETKNNGECHITSSFEGICSNLHLFINGGKTIVVSQDDGINCNEDDVSVITINEGTLRVNAGLGYEGDGIDSNGYIVINGGNIVSVAKFEMDPGIDAPCGVYFNGGNLIALGETKTVDWPEIIVNENINQKVLFKYYEEPIREDKTITIVDKEGKEIYEYSEANDKYICDYKRPFRGILITNNLMTNDKDYDIVYK